MTKTVGDLAGFKVVEVSFKPMIKQFRTTICISLTLALCTLALPQAVQATKLSPRKLPSRNGDPSGKADYDRDGKDFDSAEGGLVPVSRFKRRPDYRTLEKEKEEEEARRKEEEARKRIEAKEAKKEAYKSRLDQIKKNKQEAIQYNDEAVTFGQQGRWDDAITAHENAVKYDPGNKQFRINLSAARTALGQEKLKNSQFQAASVLLRKALAAAPENGMAGKLLSDALTKMGMDPGDADVRIGLGDQLMNQNDYQGAYIEYQQAMRIEPSARAYVKMGDIELAYRRVNEALKWYGQAIVKDPKYAPAHRQLGMLYLASKDSTKAAASLRQALILDSDDHAAGQALVGIWRDQVAKNPLSAENHLGLAGALQLSGDFVGAQSEYNKLQAIDPQNPGLAAGLESLKRAYKHATADKHRKACETLFSQGLKREALAEISQAAMMEPRNAKYQFLLGECLEANNDYKGAHQAYLTCVLIDPENNKEAAARMKEMQQAGGGSIEPVRSNHNLPAMGRSQIAPQNKPSVEGFNNQANHPMNASFNGKSMFEGAAIPQNTGFTQNATQAPAQTGFTGVQNSALGNFGQMVGAQTNQRISSQPRIFPPVNADNPIANESPKTDTVNAQTLAMAPNGNTGGITKPNSQLDASMAMVAQAEQMNDHTGAVKILKEMLNTNLQNAELHHRLAVNLMAAGRISQAVCEFRIASALKPTNKSYASDLARALSVNKRSLSSKGAGGNQ